ncbi:MAG: metal-dependent transcriptional regulator [Promethearchaeota archaeon]
MAEKNDTLKFSEFPESYHEYLKTIYRLKVGAENEYVKNVDISRELGIKPPSVTEMIEKLETNGLLVWEKRKGVKLTPLGEEVAREVITNHLYLELFFWKVLGIENPQARHLLAGEIEHHASGELIRALGRWMPIAESIDLNSDLDLSEALVERIEIPRHFSTVKIGKIVERVTQELSDEDPVNAAVYSRFRDRVLEGLDGEVVED